MFLCVCALLAVDLATAQLKGAGHPVGDRVLQVSTAQTTLDHRLRNW